MVWFCARSDPDHSFFFCQPLKQHMDAIAHPPSDCLQYLSPAARDGFIFRMKLYHMDLAFNLKISHHFKVICLILPMNYLRVAIFSSESGVWTTSEQLPFDVGWHARRYIRYAFSSMEHCIWRLIMVLIYLDSISRKRLVSWSACHQDGRQILIWGIFIYGKGTFNSVSLVLWL